MCGLTRTWGERSLLCREWVCEVDSHWEDGSSDGPAEPLESDAGCLALGLGGNVWLLGRLVHCGALSSALRLCPLDAGNMPTPVTAQMPPGIARCPRGAKPRLSPTDLKPSLID